MFKFTSKHTMYVRRLTKYTELLELMRHIQETDGETQTDFLRQKASVPEQRTPARAPTVRYTYNVRIKMNARSSIKNRAHAGSFVVPPGFPLELLKTLSLYHNHITMARRTLIDRENRRHPPGGLSSELYIKI